MMRRFVVHHQGGFGGTVDNTARAIITEYGESSETNYEGGNRRWEISALIYTKHVDRWMQTMSVLCPAVIIIDAETGDEVKWVAPAECDVIAEIGKIVEEQIAEVGPPLSHTERLDSLFDGNLFDGPITSAEAAAEEPDAPKVRDATHEELRMASIKGAVLRGVIREMCGNHDMINLVVTTIVIDFICNAVKAEQRHAVFDNLAVNVRSNINDSIKQRNAEANDIAVGLAERFMDDVRAEQAMMADAVANQVKPLDQVVEQIVEDARGGVGAAVLDNGPTCHPEAFWMAGPASDQPGMYQAVCSVCGRTAGSLS